MHILVPFTLSKTVESSSLEKNIIDVSHVALASMIRNIEALFSNLVFTYTYDMK